MPITWHSDLDEIPPGAVQLSEVVAIQGRYLRATNTERDFFDPGSLDGYSPTPCALNSLARLCQGLSDPTSRAFSVTGPYGSGKSSCLLYSAKVLCPGSFGSADARAQATRLDPAIGRRLTLSVDEGLWPILITGSRRLVARALVEGLIEGLNRIPGGDVVVRMLRIKHTPTIETDHPSAREVADLLTAAALSAVSADVGCKGLLVVVDEMGKFLEHAARHPAAGDLQVLQEVAESACRSASAPFIFVTVLHQSFDEYAHRLSATQRHEWQKVQGRFADIPFGDTSDEALKLVSAAIQLDTNLFNGGRYPALDSGLRTHLEQCKRLKLQLASFSAAEFEDLVSGAYPVHPVTLLLLPHVFRRFGQSERSLFSFLSTDEPNSLRDFLQSKYVMPDSAPWLGPDVLYDYVAAALGSALHVHPTAKQWAEIEDGLFRVRDRSPIYGRLIKVIGLLHIVGEQSRLLPSREVLRFALSDTPSEVVDAAIADLETATMIAYRQFRKAYRLYEGSDIDVEARLKEARAYFAAGSNPVSLAARLGTTSPIVARRHSYVTGTLRYLDVRCCQADALSSEIAGGPTQGDGLLLLCVASDGADLERAHLDALALTSNRTEVIVGISMETDALHEAAVAVDCLLWVQAETPELRNDQVAGREVRARLQDALDAFHVEWDRMLRPQNVAQDVEADVPTRWVWRGEPLDVPSYRRLQELASLACDATYPHTPKLRNELVNRRQLSSTSAAARRNVIEALLLRRDQARLGIEGYPPEACIYASIFEATGIHRLDDAGAWGIMPPPAGSDTALTLVWDRIEAFLFEGDLARCPLTDLLAELRRPPFGLTDGLIPLLLCAVMAYHSDQVLIYEGGVFVHDTDVATFERMVKRPDDFSLQGCRIVGEREMVVARFARGLLRSGETPTLANVAKQLYRDFGRLTEYALRTKTIGQASRELRDAVRDCKEPEQLLFVRIPTLLVGRAFSSDGEPDAEQVAAFFEQWNSLMGAVYGAYDDLLVRLADALAGSFGVPTWSDLPPRAAAIMDALSEPQVKAFAMRLADTQLDERKWLEALATTMTGRPPVSWSDDIEDRFRNLLSPLVSAFRNAEVVAFDINQAERPADQQGIRLTVTQETGAQHARVAVIPRAEGRRIEALAARLLETFDRLMEDEPEDVRVAVLGELTQTMLRR